MRLRLTPGPALGAPARCDRRSTSSRSGTRPCRPIASRSASTPATAPPLAAPRLARRARRRRRTSTAVLDDAVWKPATRVPLLADAETGFAGLLDPARRLRLERGGAPRRARGAAHGRRPTPSRSTLAPASGGGARSFRVTTRGLAGEDAVSAARSRRGSRTRRRRRLARRAVRAVRGARSRAPRPARCCGSTCATRRASPGLLGVGARLAGRARSRSATRRRASASTAAAELALGRVALDFERNARRESPRSSSRGRAEGPGASGSTCTGGASCARRPIRPTACCASPCATTADRELGRGSRAGSRRSRRPGCSSSPSPRRGGSTSSSTSAGSTAAGCGALAAGRAPGAARRPRARRARSRTTSRSRTGRARASFAAGLAPGSHTLALELRARRAHGSRSSAGSRCRSCPGSATKLGETEGVLDPWLPLGWDDDASVRVWGRRYAFDGPLLARVSNDAAARCCARRCSSALRTAAGEASAPHHPAEVVARAARPAPTSPARGAFDGAGVDVRWSAWIEYDGVVRHAPSR